MWNKVKFQERGAIQEEALTLGHVPVIRDLEWGCLSCGLVPQRLTHP